MTAQPAHGPAVFRWTEADDVSFDEIREAVAEAISKKLALAEGTLLWVSDLGEDWAVYNCGDSDDLFKVSYTRDDAGAVTITGDPAPVDRHVTYKPEQVTEAVGPPVRVEQHIPGRVLEARGADTAGGRIFGVQIINSGDSKNGRRYRQEVLREAVHLYEGAKAYDHHRTPAELQSSTISGLVGSYRNVTVNTAGLEGELHLLPSATHTAEALDASLEAQAKGLPPLVGISHDIVCTAQPAQEGGRRFMEALRILQVHSADVVADPASGGRATRMVAGGIGDTSKSEEDDMTLKELRALLKGASPEKRAELLKEHAAVLEAAGITAEDINLLEPIAAAAAAPVVVEETKPPVVEEVKELVTVGATESLYGKAGLMGRNLVRTALEATNLNVRLTESILAELPEQFSETDVISRVRTVQRVAESLEREGLVPSVPDAKVTSDAADKKIDRLNASFDGRWSEGYISIREAYCDIMGVQVRDVFSSDLARQIMRESLGAPGYQYDSADRVTESVVSTTWDKVLGDAITRRMIMDYKNPELENWRKIVSSIVPVSDFRTQRIERLGGFGLLPTVNEGAPYQPLTSPGNEEATWAATKKGGTEDLTWETIKNDDMRQVVKIPRKLGLAAAITLHQFVWNLVLANPTCTYDSTALFAAGHGNTDTNTLSMANVSNGRKKMMKQTAYGDANDFIAPIPKFLITTVDNEELAMQITSSRVALPSGSPVGAASDIPNLHLGMETIFVPYWTASSTTAWFLAADPGMTPTLEIGFLDGKEDPEIFVQADPLVGAVFNADKITYKVRHVYGGTPLEHRGLYRGNA